MATCRPDVSNLIKCDDGKYHVRMNTWGVAWSPGSVETDTVLTVEALIFSVARDKLLWAAVSESTNPKNVDVFMKDLVTRAVKEMKKQGFSVGGRK